jgi:hypothetical protein
VAHRGDTPGRDGNGVADLRAILVHEPPEDHEADGVGELEKSIGVAELLVGPVELLVEDRLDQCENLPVDVIDRRGEKEQCADDPAVVGRRRSRRRVRGFHRIQGVISGPEKVMLKMRTRVPSILTAPGAEPFGHEP